jgi:hypothetical protein
MTLSPSRIPDKPTLGSIKEATPDESDIVTLPPTLPYLHFVRRKMHIMTNSKASVGFLLS